MTTGPFPPVRHHYAVTLATGASLMAEVPGGGRPGPGVGHTAGAHGEAAGGPRLSDGSQLDRRVHLYAEAAELVAQVLEAERAAGSLVEPGTGLWRSRVVSVEGRELVVCIDDVGLTPCDRRCGWDGS